MNEIDIEVAATPTVSESEVEIVERKGLGHPDSICDAVMEQVSVELCRAYRERFGRILHFNCDKALLAAGRVERHFGGGRLLEPMKLIMGDRATTEFGGSQIDVPQIAIDVARQWFRDHLRHVDPDKHLKYQVEIRPGSVQLAQVLRTSVSGANDSSAVVGYAPLTATSNWYSTANVI
jgi:S-adenosylmethionine synthetase